METEELLGSVTTYNENEQANTRPGAIRTSARVIKKLRQDVSQPQNGSTNEPLDKKDFSKAIDSEKTEEDKNSSKQRMPKAVWSMMEKNLFFEALNEYGKDFDSITSYICNKMKRKSTSNNNIKTKLQVSHFYYRTWHKVSKHIQFDSNVKKVAQELYSLINFGEMRKRLVSGIVSKAATRLPELVKKGVVAVRVKGKTVRVRTPMCRALRKLNKIDEWDEQLRLPLRVCVQMIARDSDAWTRVQGLAHNPRVLAPVAPSCKLGTLLNILNRKWMPTDQIISESLTSSQKKDLFTSVDSQIGYLINPSAQCNLTAEFEKICNPTEINQCKQNGSDGSSKKESSSLISKFDEKIAEEYVQKNSFNVDMMNDKEETVQNNVKTASEANNKIENSHIIYTSAINSFENHTNNDPSRHSSKSNEYLVDSIHASKTNIIPKGSILHLGPKPGVYLNLPVINISEHVTSQRICLTSYQERLEHDSLNNQSEGFKGGIRFKSQKRQRKDSGDMDVMKKAKSESFSYDKTDVFDIDETANDGMDMTATLTELKNSAIKMMLPSDDKSNEDLNDGRDKDFFSEDDDRFNNETDGEYDAGVKTTKENLDEVKNTKTPSARKLKFPKDKEPIDAINTEKNLNNLLDSPEDQNGIISKPSTNTSDFLKKNWNRDLLQEQVKKGWNVYDAGDLTIGDMYLMFGSDSKLELNYWWCESVPTTSNLMQQTTVSPNIDTVRSKNSRDNDFNDMENAMSPKLISNDEADSKKLDKEETEIMKEMSSPDPKLNTDQDPSASSTYHLISKLGINTVSNEEKTVFPWSVPQREKILTATDRLKKLLSIFQLQTSKAGESSCHCGHTCGRGKKVHRDETNSSRGVANTLTSIADIDTDKTQADIQQKDVFRTPFTRGVLLPNPDNSVKDSPATLNFESMPRWTRRGKNAKRSPQVVVKKYLPILPKPTLIPAAPPAQIVRVLPALRPKTCTKTSVKMERSEVSLVKEEILNLPYEGELYEIPVDSPSFKNIIKKEVQPATLPTSPTTSDSGKWSTIQNIDNDKKIVSEASLSNMLDISLPSNLMGEDSILNSLKSVRANLTEKQENFSGLWNPTESLSMSPSRLLKENDDHWIDTEVNNFSLSSFLGHLEAPGLSTPMKSETPIGETNQVNDSGNDTHSFISNLSAGIL